MVDLPLLSPEAGYVRIASFRAGVVEDLRKQIADALEVGREIAHHRRPPNGRGARSRTASRPPACSSSPARWRSRRAARARRKETVEARAGDGAVTLPVQILITSGTSGAAELFAAALSGNKRAELVGEHTIGRAAVQKLVKLPEGRGLWLTYARYYRPGGVRHPGDEAGRRPGAQARADGSRPRTRPVESMIREAPIQGKGLKPDVEVDDADVVEFGAATSDKDPILDAALDRLKNGLVE